ncbi:DNA polymerase IV [Candidatus Daviesbacteria bacterium]|nr:DNA polymerase IV [Candidatus Daviesbacteria bacterium]
MTIILHVDFNSYFAAVEQQANPRLRGKPIGVTGGDRIKRTVLGAASVEAKRFGVKTGMLEWQAKQLCPQIILVQGDSDKYLETTKRFLNILKCYSPYLEVFSIDEAFMELPNNKSEARNPKYETISNVLNPNVQNVLDFKNLNLEFVSDFDIRISNFANAVRIALDIKSRIKSEIGEWITCSIGISYNKLMAKLAGSLQKPDGLVVIPNQEEAIKVLDKIELDEICGIGPRIKKRLNNMGIFDFQTLRQASLQSLLASFKSYGQILYNMARGIDYSKVMPFYEKEEVKSIGHRHTIDHDTDDPLEIKQILLKLTEMVARRLRAKNLVGKTIHCWYRSALHPPGVVTFSHPEGGFTGNGMQITIQCTNDGLDIFKTAWKVFRNLWGGEKIRMVGVSISNLRSQIPQNLSLLPEIKKTEIITKVLDKINDKYGEFTLQRGIMISLNNADNCNRRSRVFRVTSL